MTDRSTGPRCGNNPNTRLTPGDRKAVDDAKARLALLADARPYIDRAVWVDGDPLMEVIASTVWRHCGRDSEDMPQLVCDDPRTIAAFAAAVARADAEAMRERHKANLRRADEINNELMEEVQRYAAGTERPVLWSVYNRMHLRAIEAETELEKLRRAEPEAADRAPTLRELEQQQRPNTPPSRPDASPIAPPVKQRADCTELEWAVQERARFEQLYTRETVRADLAEQRADTAARDADIYQKRLERLGEGYTEQRKRAEKAEEDANHNAELVADTVQRAEQAEAEAERLRADQTAEFTAADLVATLRSAGAERDRIEAQARTADRAAVLRETADHYQRLADAAFPGDRPDYYEALADVAVGLRRMADETQQPGAMELPYTHTDDDSDQLIIGAVNASTYDGEVPQVFVCAREFSDDAKEETTVYIRPEFVERAVAAMRVARVEADRMAATTTAQQDGAQS